MEGTPKEQQMTSSQPWQYDEMRHVGTDYNSEAEVENYDRRMGTIRDIQSEIQEIISAIDLSPDDTILEFGSGTGEFAAVVSERCRQVYAVDISRVMLSYAEKKARSRGRDNIRFINAGFLNYRHEGEPLDAVVTQLALHHLPDFWKQVALVKMNGLLKAGGRLYLRDVVFSLKLEKYEATVNHVLDNFRKTSGEEMVDKFSNHVRNEYSTFDWVMEEMLYRAGFDIDSAEYGDNFMAVYACSKRRVE
jgi:putative AdoMet-dependent methyltransferase